MTLIKGAFPLLTLASFKVVELVRENVVKVLKSQTFWKVNETETNTCANMCVFVMTFFQPIENVFGS